MSFNVELYWFSDGSEDLRYCSNDKPYVHLGNTYLPNVVKSDNRKVSPKIEDARRKLTVPINSEIAKRVLRTPRSSEIRLVVYKVNSASSAQKIGFNGLVLGGQQKKEQMVLVCQSIISTLNITGLGLRVGRGCSNALYGPRCGINRGDHLVVGSVSAIDGLSVTVDGLVSADGKYNGGYAEWDSIVDSANQVGSISDQVGNVITFISIPSTLAVGTTIKTYRGCDQTFAVCRDDFGNTDNYLGVPFLSAKNPGGGTTLF